MVSQWFAWHLRLGALVAALLYLVQVAPVSVFNFKYICAFTIVQVFVSRMNAMLRVVLALALIHTGASTGIAHALF